MEEVKEQIVNHKKFKEALVAFKTAFVAKTVYDRNIDKAVNNMDMIAEELECNYDEVFDTLKSYIS